jgi:hypothetical protein
MAARLLALFVLPTLLLTAASKQKTVATARGENEDLVLTITLYIDTPGVKELVGDDLGGHYIVADVKVEPKYGKEISIDRDDFTLRSDKDGEKSRPMAASQIAGRGALVISQTASPSVGGGGNAGTQYPGGYPGGGYPGGGYPSGRYPGGGYPPMGSPPVMGTGGGVGGGTGGSENGDATAASRSSAQDKENPLEKVLAGKILQELKTDKPSAGLLYFAMEKQKMKDLEMVYGGRENRITVRFK